MVPNMTQQLSTCQDVLVSASGLHSRDCRLKKSSRNPKSSGNAHAAQLAMTNRLSGLPRLFGRRPSLQDAGTLLQVFDSRLAEAQAASSNSPAIGEASLGTSQVTRPALTHQRKGTGLSAHESDTRQAAAKTRSSGSASRNSRVSDHASMDHWKEAGAVHHLQARLQQVNAQPNTNSTSSTLKNTTRSGPATLQHRTSLRAPSTMLTSREDGINSGTAARRDEAKSAPLLQNVLQQNTSFRESEDISRPVASWQFGERPGAQAQQPLQPPYVSSMAQPGSDSGKLLQPLVRSAGAAASSAQTTQQVADAAKPSIDPTVPLTTAPASSLDKAFQNSSLSRDWKSFLQRSGQLRPNWDWDDFSEELDLALNQLPDGSAPGALDWTGTSRVASKPSNLVRNWPKNVPEGSRDVSSILLVWQLQ